MQLVFFFFSQKDVKKYLYGGIIVVKDSNEIVYLSNS